MSKFQKRSTERKGERKSVELEEKLIQENLKDLVSEGGEVSD
ncbi:hypothetical protein V7O66_01740 [Methanolobus sp. ZRKC3]